MEIYIPYEKRQARQTIDETDFTRSPDGRKEASGRSFCTASQNRRGRLLNSQVRILSSKAVEAEFAVLTASESWSLCVHMCSYSQARVSGGKIAA